METSMVRYECLECDMTATVVHTAAARSAWTDHMLTHARMLRYRTWAWTVIPIWDGDDM